MKSTDVYTKLEFQAEILIVNFNPELKKEDCHDKNVLLYFIKAQTEMLFQISSQGQKYVQEK